MVLEDDPALEARVHLAHVVLDPAQRGDLAVVHRRTGANQPRLGAAPYEAVDDHAPGDGGLARGEDLAHLGVAEGGLDHLGLEHPGERLLDVLEELVDDLVLAHIDPRGVRDTACRRLHLRVEADDDGARSRRKREVRFGDVADGVVDDREGDLVLWHLREGALDRFERALHVDLEDDLELLRLAFLHLREHLVERRRGRGGGPGGPLARVPGDERARGLLVRHDADDVAGFGDLGEAEDLDRPRRLRPADVLGLVVDHRPDLAERGPGDDEVAALQGAGLHEDGRDGSAALVEVRFDDAADRRPVRIRLEVRDVGDLRAARAHGGERLVTGRVEERHLAAVVLDLVRADVLGDPTCLARGHVRQADRVEEARLPVVDVPEDGDDRRTLLQLAAVLVGPEDLLARRDVGLDLLLDGRRHLLLGLRLQPELVRDEGGGLEVDGLVDRGHHAHVHKTAYYVDDRDLERAGEVAHGYRLRQHDDVRLCLGHRHRRGRLRRGRLLDGAWGPAPLRTPSALGRQPAWSRFWHLVRFLLRDVY